MYTCSFIFWLLFEFWNFFVWKETGMEETGDEWRRFPRLSASWDFVLVQSDEKYPQIMSKVSALGARFEYKLRRCQKQRPRSRGREWKVRPDEPPPITTRLGSRSRPGLLPAYDDRKNATVHERTLIDISPLQNDFSVCKVLLLDGFFVSTGRKQITNLTPKRWLTTTRSWPVAANSPLF